MQKTKTPEVSSNNGTVTGSGEWEYNEKTCKQTKRCWDIVINNFTNQDENVWNSEMSKYDYSEYQIEEGEEKYTLHLQGCVWHNNKIAAHRIKALFPRASFRPAKCEEALLKYCRKTFSRVRGPYEFGSRPHQGQRVDLEEACKTYKIEGIAGVLSKHLPTYIKYSKGFENLTMKHLHNNPRHIAPVCRYMFQELSPYLYNDKITFGDCMEKIENDCPNMSVHIQDDENPWWDGYEQQDVLVYIMSKPLKDLNYFTSRQVYKVKIHGGMRNLNSPVIYFIDSTKIII
nr:MAG: replication associated protein [Cressdnaviricota sp.]